METNKKSIIMTEYQKKAKKYLSKYRSLLKKLDYLAERIEEQRAKSTSVKSSLNIETGIDKKGKSQLVARSKTFDPGARERLLHILVFQCKEYDQKKAEAEILAGEIEDTIDSLLDDDRYKLVLKYVYIQQNNYRQVAYKLSYSYQHIKRLHWEGLEELGKKMSPHEP